MTLGNLGGVAMKMGDYGRAGRLFAEDLAARRALGDMWGIASALNNLAEWRAYAEIIRGPSRELRKA